MASFDFLKYPSELQAHPDVELADLFATQRPADYPDKLRSMTVEQLYWFLRGLVTSGFVDRADSVLSYSDAARSITLEPASTSFDVISGGNRLTITESQTIVPANTDGMHYIWVDENGALQTQHGSAPSTWLFHHAAAAEAYWNTTDSEWVLVGDERHETDMDWAVHRYLHRTRAASLSLDGGLAMTGVVSSGSGSADADAQFGYSAGTLWDEDIPIERAADSAPVNTAILYRSGANGYWRKTAAQNFLVTTAGTGRAAWNEWTGATWQLTEVTNNQFVSAHVVATNDIINPVIVLPGQSDYATLNAAQLGIPRELASMDLAGLPAPEHKDLASFVLQSSNTYTNTVKSRVRPLASGASHIDWRYFTSPQLLADILDATP